LIKGFADIVEKEDSEAAAKEHRLLLSLKRPTGIAGIHAASGAGRMVWS
jgi:hypothetical protein